MHVDDDPETARDAIPFVTKLTCGWVATHSEH